MHDLVKSTLKEILPPGLVRLLQPKDRSLDAWGTPRYGLHGLKLPGGQRFDFRPSVPDRAVCRQIFFRRDYATDHLLRAQEIVDFYQACSDPMIVDAGANIGASAVWFALTYPKAKILAIEPDVSNFELLKSNSIPFASVVPLNAAIASTSGTLYLDDPGGGAWAYRTAEQPTDHSYPVEAMTLEQVMAKSSGTPFILKIDIEGAEEDLFSRPSEDINRFPLVIIELHDWMIPRKSNSRNFLKWHVDMQRDFVYSGENVFSISNAIRGV
ncbi:FkbM family methyltransferase [Paraburkholderia kirstenboschensis]|uniref:FkbM family methyltransferase n=1 Tax=Paraburkholderia kirstenboschensis TaxID=1245436 RepID=A0ABZ0EU52_9BURK|nr:FkbM family methyltransferase [Paraburkholderia kirstenboschensis]WOD20697.1 FkbM family methyltransferase [Paraburkholderia kirstenboschensis]